MSIAVEQKTIAWSIEERDSGDFPGTFIKYQCLCKKNKGEYKRGAVYCIGQYLGFPIIDEQTFALCPRPIVVAGELDAS